jgi:hypothetical protein
VHVCPDCGKSMATLGGLEIHAEMYHALPPPPPPEPLLNPEALDADGQSGGAPERLPVRAPPPAVRPAASRGATSVLRGYDATVPLTALLVLTMLVAAIGAAVHRSTNPTHVAVASISSGVTAPTSGVTPTTLAPVGQPPATSVPSPAGSPAAIPPAGSQPPAAAQNSTASDCKQLVDSLSNRNSKRNVDIGSLVRTNTFPAMPLQGFDHPAVAGLGHYGTVGEYLNSATFLDPSERDAFQQALIKDGFVSEDTIAFVNGESSCAAGVLQFTTAAGARDYNRASTLIGCNEGIIQNAQVMPALSGGMNYVIQRDGPPFRATFVAGDTVVRFSICHCVQAPDDQVLAGQWAQAVASAVGAG